MNPLPRRKRLRLEGFDYSAGAYFITTCTYRRRPLFAEERIQRIIEWTWLDLRNHFPHLDLDAFVVMPNHIHGIIILAPTAAGEGCSRNTHDDFEIAGQPSPTSGHNALRRGVPAVLRVFKTFSARRVNDLRRSRSPVWQRSYHDRIIRAERSLDRIRQYIFDNPANWESDPYNPNSGVTSEDALWAQHFPGMNRLAQTERL